MRFIYSDLVLGAFFNQKKIGITQLLKLIKYNMLLYCIINGVRFSIEKSYKLIFTRIKLLKDIYLIYLIKIFDE